ncbi:MAG TPA: hypothetical protein VNK70_00140 [Candidatus Paceibacterota bacterium]|nr:hypothetical protein [Candidatus Paceibacterota bacterium]
MLEVKLGEHYPKALELFDQYSDGANGAELSFALTNALMHATDKGKVSEVLAEFERHWEKDLQFQHPDIRGTVGSLLAAPMSHTDIVFKRIYEDILGLKKSE